jgi:hypothetical protein
MAMENSLSGVLRTLRAHERELRRLGASHAAVFGSVARGDARAGSDILDNSHLLAGINSRRRNEVQPPMTRR